MIKTEKELQLLGVISKLFKEEIEEPKGIYVTEVSEFATEMEQNLLAMDKRNQKIYLKRVVEKFCDWIDETTISQVNATGKPKNKRDRNLRALVFTVNNAKACIETNIRRFLSKDENKSAKEEVRTILFKEHCETKAIEAFESVLKTAKGKSLKPSPIHFKSASIAFRDLNVTNLSQTKFIQEFSSKYGLTITGGKNVQVDRKNKSQIELSGRIIKAYNEVK